MIDPPAEIYFGNTRTMLSAHRSDRQRTSLKSVGEFGERRLGIQPARVAGNGVHGRLRIVADEVKLIASADERFEARSDFVPRKIEMPGLMLRGQDFCAQSAEVV